MIVSSILGKLLVLGFGWPSAASSVADLRQTASQRGQHGLHLYPGLLFPWPSLGTQQITRLQHFLIPCFCNLDAADVAALYHLLYLVLRRFLADPSHSTPFSPYPPAFLLLHPAFSSYTVGSVPPTPLLPAAAFSNPMGPPAGVSSLMLSSQSRCTKHGSLHLYLQIH